MERTCQSCDGAGKHQVPKLDRRMRFTINTGAHVIEITLMELLAHVAETDPEGYMRHVNKNMMIEYT